MHFDTRITLKEILRHQHRPGFAQAFHKVLFKVESEGIDPLEIGIWVHPCYPEKDLIKIGRSFLAGRFMDMTKVASEDTYTPSEVDALWQTVKPLEII